MTDFNLLFQQLNIIFRPPAHLTTRPNKSECGFRDSTLPLPCSRIARPPSQRALLGSFHVRVAPDRPSGGRPHPGYEQACACKKAHMASVVRPTVRPTADAHRIWVSALCRFDRLHGFLTAEMCRDSVIEEQRPLGAPKC